jgi:hypothetical protein
MSIFNGTSFNDYREKRLNAALARIHASNDPASVEADVIESFGLDEISVAWNDLVARSVATEIYVEAPITGEPHLFMLRVSTNHDPLPNCTVVNPDVDDEQVCKLVWRYTLNQPLTTILNAAQSARTIAQQHVNFVNDGIRLYNQTLDAKVRDAVRNRLVAFGEAAKVAAAINERLNPARV